jgi:hypothetical protein
MTIAQPPDDQRGPHLIGGRPGSSIAGLEHDFLVDCSKRDAVISDFRELRMHIIMTGCCHLMRPSECQATADQDSKSKVDVGVGLSVDSRHCPLLGTGVASRAPSPFMSFYVIGSLLLDVCTDVATEDRK